jgi:hypothetical protein
MRYAMLITNTESARAMSPADDEAWRTERRPDPGRRRLVDVLELPGVLHVRRSHMRQADKPMWS